MSSTSHQGFGLAYGQGDGSKDPSDSRRVPRPLTPASPMLTFAAQGAQPISSPADVPMLQDRSVDGRSAMKKSASKFPQGLDLASFGRRDSYDFFAAELPKLTRESQVRDDQCGLTFRCQTHSWGDTILALTFSSCDLTGKASGTNKIGVQALSDYPDNWCYTEKQVPVGDLVSSLLRSVAGFGLSNGLRVQYNDAHHSKHVLMLGALEEKSAFKMELWVNALFPDGMPVCPEVVPREMVLFATTDTLCFGPLTEILYLRAGERKIFLRGRNSEGVILNQFYTDEKPGDVPETQKMLNRVPSRPCCRIAVRLLITPAIIFDMPPAKQEKTVSVTASRCKKSTDGQVMYCQGVGTVKLKTVLPSGDLRLLPSVAIDVIAIDPPLTGGSSDVSISMEEGAT